MPVGRFIFQTSMASPQIGIRSPLWTVYYFVAGACPPRALGYDSQPWLPGTGVCGAIWETRIWETDQTAGW